MSVSGNECAHFCDEIRFSFKAYSRQVRHGDVTVDHLHPVGETAIGLEQIGVTLVAAKPQAGCDVERHLMSAMRNATSRRPAVGSQHVKGSLVLDKAIGQRAVELQPVAIGA